MYVPFEFINESHGDHGGLYLVFGTACVYAFAGVAGFLGAAAFLAAQCIPWSVIRDGITGQKYLSGLKSRTGQQRWRICKYNEI
jgi:hypothetical protein